MTKFLAGLLVCVIAAGALWPMKAKSEPNYFPHKIGGFQSSEVRVYDVERRKQTGVIRSSQLDPDQNKVVRLRSVDDFVCVEKPAATGGEVCVLAADLQPCLCQSAASRVTGDQTDLTGLAGVVTPNGGTCSC